MVFGEAVLPSDAELDLANFAPDSTGELTEAIQKCMEQTNDGDCTDTPYGPIGEWSVSRIADMSNLFIL